jgi:hypothetical protein
MAGRSFSPCTPVSSTNKTKLTAKIELKSNIVERDVKHHNPLNISGFGKHPFLLSGYT